MVMILKFLSDNKAWHGNIIRLVSENSLSIGPEEGRLVLHSIYGKAEALAEASQVPVGSIQAL